MIAKQIGDIITRNFDVEVKLADSCAAARAELGAGTYDIVTLDFMLPDGQGLDLLEEITTDEPHPEVIMVTGHGSEETAVRSFRLSASGYVVKDASLYPMLKEAIERALVGVSLKKAQQAVRASEEYYRSLIENASDIILIMGEDRIIRYASPSVERQLGYTPEELTGTDAFDLVHTDDLATMSEMLVSELQQPGSTPAFRYRARASDRTWHNIESITRNLLSNPSVRGIVMNSRDVTRRILAEEQLKEYRDHLERLVDERTAELRAAMKLLEVEVEERKSAEEEVKRRAERLRHFLAVASHELRHPISVVKGYTTMLSGHLEDISPDSLPEILDNINASTDRLTTYVEELMDVSRIEEGCSPMQKIETETRLLFGNALGDMAAKGRENRIGTSIAEDASVLNVDPQEFCKALVILIDNATKFSSPASPVEVRADRDGLEVVVSVLDRGIGVPEEARETIFERFYQVEEVEHHSTPGLGLGLYIAREIVEAHGGRIRCEAREGGGSAFRLSLPDSG